MLRACLKNGWRGQPARPARQPADRNGSGCRNGAVARIVHRCRTHSVRQVAGWHRLVARATQNSYFRQALRTKSVFRAALICGAWIGSIGTALCQPVQLRIQPTNGQVVVSWPNGLNLVQPQKATNLALSSWLDFGAATTATNLTNTAATGQAFYRLRFLSPVIVESPQEQSASAGGNVALKVSATGTAPFAYQWQRNKTNLAGQVAATLALTNFAAADAGDYAAVIGNRAGSVTSAVAVVKLAAVAVVPKGIHMGVFTGQTNGGYASLVNSNRQAIILAYDSAQNQGVLATNVVPATDGSFTALLAQGASFKGAYAPDSVSGTLIATNGMSGAFSAPRKSETGIQQANAGYYAGTFGGLLNGEVYFILAADGAAFTYLSSPILTGGTFGSIDAANTLSAIVSYTLPGGTAPSLILITGTLNPTTHQFTGAYSFSGITLGSFNLTRVFTP